MTDKTPLGADKIKEAAERYAVQNYPILADGQISRKKETERNKTYANSFIAGATSEAAREYWQEKITDAMREELSETNKALGIADGFCESDYEYLGVLAESFKRITT